MKGEGYEANRMMETNGKLLEEIERLKKELEKEREKAEIFSFWNILTEAKRLCDSQACAECDEKLPNYFRYCNFTTDLTYEEFVQAAHEIAEWAKRNPKPAYPSWLSWLGQLGFDGNDEIPKAFAEKLGVDPLEVERKEKP